jgi:hypothetical protein
VLELNGEFVILQFATYEPNVHESMKPFVGQIFDSLKAVEDFYRSYAKAACFCIGDILPAAYLKL